MSFGIGAVVAADGGRVRGTDGRAQGGSKVTHTTTASSDDSDEAIDGEEVRC